MRAKSPDARVAPPLSHYSTVGVVDRIFLMNYIFNFVYVSR